MYDASMSLQHTDFAHATEYPHSLQNLEHLVAIFDAHAGHEDGHLFPLLQACNPALQDEMEKEHVKDIALSNELRSLTASFRSATNAEAKRELGNKICYTFYAYIAFNLEHMNKEEQVVNESLWSHYSDMEIIQANMRMVAGLSPDEVRRNAVWMMRGCSNADLIGWLNSIKKQVPAPVIDLLLGIAESELSAHRFEAVRNAVVEPVQMS